jgi:hypothetical protein
MRSNTTAIPELSSTYSGQWSAYMQSETSIVTKIDTESEYVIDGDVILMFTANHSYEFTVTDSSAGRGQLSGGALKDQKVDATSSALIQTGYGAVFNIELHGSRFRLATSDIVKLVYVREHERLPVQILKFLSAGSATANC